MSKQQSDEQDENSRHFTLDVFDGKASIEQQLEVHVHDLVDVKVNKSISLSEVLEGLRYVMDFRIRGDGQHHLDVGLMKRLCEALLLNTGVTEGQLLRKRTTACADMAFFLFGDFLEEVVEFRTVVGEKDVYDLRSQLKIHYRCQSSSDPKQKRGAIAMVQLLTSYFQHCSDWHDLVKSSEHSSMEALLKSPLAAEVAHEQSKMPRQNMLPSHVLPPPQALYFDRTVEKLLRMFPHTHPEKGLPAALIASLREQYGTNTLPDPPKPSALRMLWTQLTDFMVLILLAATIAQAGQQEFNSMAVLLVVIVLNTVIGFSQEWKASKTLSALMHLSVPKAQVIRDGEAQIIDSGELVPGDLVVLEEGDAIPADIRLIEVGQLEAIESILTGESLPVMKTTDAVKAKSRRIPLGDCIGNVFMSTTVARGRGKGIVVRIGEQTEIGKISTAIQAGSKRKTKTPIQRRLDKLGKYLVVIAVVLCALVVVIGIAWKHDVMTMVNVGISLAVSVIPEGLVAVTTVTMALGVRRMAANQCIVRTLPAVESLGSVTTICSDKTGTLTEGNMGAAELWTGDNALYRFTESTSFDPTRGQIIVEPAQLRRRMIHVRRTVSQAAHADAADHTSTVDYAALRPRPIDTRHPLQYEPHLFYALMVTALCNNASIHYDQETQSWKSVGDPTEVALTIASQKANLGRSIFLDGHQMTKIHERSFDSDRKLMSCAFRSLAKGPENKDGFIYLVCKGAPEEVLRNCAFYLHHETQTAGTPNRAPGVTSISAASSSSATSADTREDFPLYATKPITETFIDTVSDESSRMASNGLRVLGLALKRFPIECSSEQEPAQPTNAQLAEQDLVFVGLIGLIDPPKQGVKEAVETCQRAGIRVAMITGDHIDTAVAIASQLSIFQKHVEGMNRAILGRELDILSEDAIMELHPFPTVFARVSPDNKLKIVRALQLRGEIVAMTGDGVNDAPAIKSADVGVAMGQAGTEITKQAADLVLLDDNFTTIVAAVEEGRHVFDNILKFIVYLLSCNGAEIFLMLICSMANLQPPLTVMMILWSNIIADIPPAMALGVEPKEQDIMSRAPRNPSSGVLTKAAWCIILYQSLLVAAMSISAYVYGLRVLGLTEHDAQSLVFTHITTLQLIHAFLSQSIPLSVFRTGILRNRWMIGAFFLSFGLMILGIYAPGISTWLELTFVGWQAWVVVLVSCVVLVVAIEIEKWIVRHFDMII